MASSTFTQASLALNTNKVFLTIISLSHEGWAEDLTMVNRPIALTSNGVVYEPYGFVFTPPASVSKGQPTAKLVIDDIDRVFTKAIREIKGKVTVTVSVLLEDNPDQIELGPIVLSGSNFSLSGSQASLQLEKYTILGNNLNGFNMSADYFPGLFL